MHGAQALKVLLLTHRMPFPPDKGDKIRSNHLLETLCSRHEVDLVTQVDDADDLRHREALSAQCRRLHLHRLHPLVSGLRATAALVSGRSLSVAWMTRPRVRRLVRGLLDHGGYDLVIGYSSQVADYLPETASIPTILDFVDVDSRKWARYAREKPWPRGALDALEARRVAAFERVAARRVQQVVVATERELEAARPLLGETPALAIGNAIRSPLEDPPAAGRSPGLMVFVGTMDYQANVQAAVIAAREVLPLVRRRVTGARLRIVGRRPPRSVRVLADLPGVEVTGEVRDVAPHLRAACLALLPLRVARGLQNKVLEALAHGLPVVTTPGVCASLEASVGGAVRAAATSEDLAREAASLLRDPRVRERSAALGRRWVAEHHDGQLIAGRWHALIDAVRERWSEQMAGGARGLAAGDARERPHPVVGTE